MIVGMVAFAAWILLTGAWNARAEKVGEMTVLFLFPAVVTGLVARGRRWSWGLIAAVYAVVFAIALVLSVIGARDR
jgi:Na+/melibiose symporter-like transporter